jgi:hypothetical protein
VLWIERITKSCPDLVVPRALDRTVDDPELQRAVIAAYDIAIGDAHRLPMSEAQVLQRRAGTAVWRMFETPEQQRARETYERISHDAKKLDHVERRLRRDIAFAERMESVIKKQRSAIERRKKAFAEKHPGWTP